jgi:thiamine biosynthesis lipoprotein
VSREAHRSFACFGGSVTIHVRASEETRSAAAAEQGRRFLLDAHDRLSRFDPESELSRLNRDPRAEVPATQLLRSLAAAVAIAGANSGGLVDATLLEAIERAGYRESLGEGSPIPLAEALASREQRAPAGPQPSSRWRSVGADETAGTVVRPPGVAIDSGGIAKGLLADLLAAGLADHPAYAVDCCGDVRIGGSAGLERRVLVDDPFDGEPIHELRLREGAAATSGIGRRCWPGPDGRPAHHLLDPSSGEPAFTGIVQATALAKTALLAETRAKAALLSGPERAEAWLPEGGVLVHDGGELEVVPAGRTRKPRLIAS